MAKAAEQDFTAEIVFNGEKITIDSSDIDGVEWTQIKRVTAYGDYRGMTPLELFEAIQRSDMEAIAALMWTYKRRTNPTLPFEDVLRSVSLASFNVVDSEGEDTPPSD